MDTPESMHSETKMHKQKEYFGIINATLVFMIAHSTQGMFYTNVDVQPIQTKKNHKKKKKHFHLGLNRISRSWWKHFFPNLKGQAFLKGHDWGRKEGREGTPTAKSTTQGTFERSVIETHTYTQHKLTETT